MPISAEIRNILLVRDVWTFSCSASYPYPSIFRSFFSSFLLSFFFRSCKSKVGITFYVVMWKLASPLDILWDVGYQSSFKFVYLCEHHTWYNTENLFLFCVPRTTFSPKLVMSNMSNERRVTSTAIYFPYSAICNLWLLIHYASVRSGAPWRIPVVNLQDRGK